MKNRQVVVVLAESSYQTLADLAGKTLAVQAESSAVEALDKATAFKASLKSVVELDDNVMAMLDLDAKASDAILLDEIVANYYIQQKAPSRPEQLVASGVHCADHHCRHVLPGDELGCFHRILGCRTQI